MLLHRLPQLPAMRLSLRFILPLVLALAAVAYAVIPLVDRLTLRWFERDLDSRATLIVSASDELLKQVMEAGDKQRLLQLFTRMTQDEKLDAIGYCASPDSAPVATPTFSRELRCSALDSIGSRLLPGRAGSLYVSVRPLEAGGVSLGRLVLVHDLGF
ncbi:MAG: trehalose-6-phosphate synthase, partial [bacterium]